MKKLDHTRRRIMRRFRLDEISAVDNPAQAPAKFKILKREDDDMPWSAEDAQRHTRKADTPEKKAKWAKIANAALEDGKDEGYAIRVANAAIGKAAAGGEVIVDAVVIKIDANGDVTFDQPYWKREFSAEERRSDAESGAAEPDGSYPIKNATDLHNAMRAIGRSKNPAKTKAHIRARAKALGLESELSEAFKRNVVTDVVDKFWGGRLAAARAALAKSVQSIIEDDDVSDADRQALLAKSVDEFTAHMAELSADLTKAMSGGCPDHPGEDDMSAELKKVLGLPADATADQIAAAVAKLAGTVEKAKDDEIERLRKEMADLKAALAKAEMTEEEKAHHDGLKDDGEKEKFRRAEHAERREMMRKNIGSELVASLEVTKLQSEKDALAKRVAQLEEQATLAEFTKRVVAMGLPESKAKSFMTMCKNAKTDEEKAAVAEFEKDMTSAIAAAREGGLFKEFGASGRGEQLTPYEELMTKAEELRKAKPELTIEQAFTKVYADPANAAIVKRERANKFSGENDAAA